MRRSIIKIFFGNLLMTILLFGLFGVFVDSVKAAGASLYLTPSTGTYVIGGEFSVFIKLSTDGQAVNAGEGELNYDTDFLEVVNVSHTGSIFSLWPTEPFVDGGSIKFAGGVPMPGYNGNSGYVFGIKFRAKASGIAQVNFTSGAVLANDSKGTNILASMGVGSYTISPRIEAPTSELPIADNNKDLSEVVATDNNSQKTVSLDLDKEYNRPEIESITNPDQNAWSKNSNIKFNWSLSTGTKDVAFVLNKEPVWDLTPKSEGLLSQKEFVDVEDGIWYFHLRFRDAKKWGSIATYRVMIDTRPPNPLEVKISEVGIGEWPELLFFADDSGSGLDDYEVYIGSLEHQSYRLSSEEKMLKISSLSIGEHTAMVVAKDKAGNEIVSTVKFKINPIESPIITSYQKEMESSDDFYLSGTALPNVGVNIYLQKDGQFLASSTVRSNDKGEWFYIGEKKLSDGRYNVWVEAFNDNGIGSNASEKTTFLVSPPVFAVIGNFVINYFTVLVVLMFMIVMVVVSIFYLISKIRKHLNKETLDVENISRKSLEDLEIYIDEEFARLKKFEGKINYAQENKKMKNNLRARVATAEKKILKEVREVEDILR